MHIDTGHGIVEELFFVAFPLVVELLAVGVEGHHHAHRRAYKDDLVGDCDASRFVSILVQQTHV